MSEVSLSFVFEEQSPARALGIAGLSKVGNRRSNEPQRRRRAITKETFAMRKREGKTVFFLSRNILTQSCILGKLTRKSAII